MLETPESVAPATSYATEVDSWHQSAYAQNDWPEMVEQAQPEHTGYSYEDASFVGTATQETYTVTPGPGNDGRCYRDLFVDWCLMFETPESVAPATSYATEVDSWRQPAYAQSEWPKIIEQAQPHYTGYSNQGTSFVGTTTQGTYSATPGPSSSKHIFYSTTFVRDITLTNHEKSRSTTRGKPSAGPRRPCLTGPVLELGARFRIQLTPFHSGMYRQCTGVVPVQLGLSWFYHPDTSLMESTVLGPISTEMRRQAHQPWCNHPHHTLRR